MLISKKWIQEYVEEQLPATDKLVETLSLHAFEVEGVERVGDDDVLDIDILPNRAHDALGHWGVACEIATLLDLTFKQLDIAATTDDGVRSDEAMTLTVEDNKLVPRAMKRLVVDVAVGESPDWLKEKLTAMGQRSINNIVDATNFVTFETNQPVHAFDYDKLSGEKKNIVIRGIKEGQKIETLDGELYELPEGTLVIADGEIPLDVAGIKGGSNSGIDENTKRIVLSVCNFDQTKIRKTSRTLGLVTDASKRFGQGLSPELPDIAMERLSQLMHELAGGKVAEDVLDVYPRPPQDYKVGVSVSEINILLGIELSKSKVSQLFDRLGFAYEEVGNPIQKALEYAQTLEGKPYKYGASIVYDAPDSFDCSSFIAHTFVQVGIGIPRMTIDQFVYAEPVDEKDLQPGDVVFARNDEGGAEELEIESLGVKQQTLHTASKEFLPGTKVDGGVDHNGLYLGDGKIMHAARRNGERVAIEDLEGNQWFKNIVGYRRVPEADQERFVVTVPHERLDIRIKQDLIEEIGRVYGYGNIKATVPEIRKEPNVLKEFYYINKIRDILVNEGFSEVYTYSFAEEGDIELANPFGGDRPFLRSSLYATNKSALAQGERHKDLFGQDVVKMFEIGNVFTKTSEYLSLSLSAAGMKSGKIENLLRKAEKKLDEEIKSSLKGEFKEGILEVNLTKALEKLEAPGSYDDLNTIDTSGVQFKHFSSYPFVLRDIAVWVPEDVDAKDLFAVIRESSGELLMNATLFDEYAKDGRVSYAYRLVFQSYEKTLSDEEVNGVMDKVNKTLEKKGWEVR